MDFDEATRESVRELLEKMERQMRLIADIRNKQKERRQRDEPVECERRSGKDRRKH